MKRICNRLATYVMAATMLVGLVPCGSPNGTAADVTTAKADAPGAENTTEKETSAPEVDADNASEATNDLDKSSQDATPSSQHQDTWLTEEPVTYKCLGLQMNNTRPSNLDETQLMMKLQEETNVIIEWELVPQTAWTEKKNLTIAGRDYPDAFFGPRSLTQEEVQQFGADGVLIELGPLLDAHAPNINKIREEYPDYDSFITSADGKIYQLASFGDEGFDTLISTIINEEWLTNLDLEMPTTTDEFYDVLKAFKEKDADGDGDPDNEIPFSFLFQEGDDLNREVKRDFRPVYYAFGVIDTPFYIAISDDDEVNFTANTDEWKAATAYMHKLYAEGLIDQEVFTQDRTLLTNKLRTQQNVGAYIDYRKDYSMLADKAQEEKYGFVPALISPSGQQVWARCANYAEGGFAITEKAENPELLVRWIDYYHQPEYSVQMGYGMFMPEGYDETEALVPSPDEPGKWVVNERPEDVDPSDWFMSGPIAQGCTLLTRSALDTYIASKPSAVAKLEACEVYRPHLSKWPYNYAYKFTPEEVDELGLLQQDIVSHVLRTQARWITDGGIEAEWDDYLNQLELLNVERYVELYREAFQRIEGQ